TGIEPAVAARLAVERIDGHRGQKTGHELSERVRRGAAVGEAVALEREAGARDFEARGEFHVAEVRAADVIEQLHGEAFVADERYPRPGFLPLAADAPVQFIHSRQP